MTIEVQRSRPVKDDEAALEIIHLCQTEEQDLGLTGALLYYGYPRYRDSDDNIFSAQLLLASPNHGVLLFGTMNSTGRSAEETDSIIGTTEAFFAMVNSKLLATKSLRRNPRTLNFPLEAYLYAPVLDAKYSLTAEFECLHTPAELRKVLTPGAAIAENIFAQLVATIDGSRNIQRPKKRDLAALPPTSKGCIVDKLEAELSRFDSKQREGSTTVITGPQRIRGLAGSGKTIVLTRKAALAHLDMPEANIAYTFHTKSLYQQIRRLITRFYRTEHEQDPNWAQLHILHSWGGKSDAGIYSSACAAHGIPPISYDTAKRNESSNPFGFACRTLLKSASIKPIYDYIFIDEGQDFPPEFIQLCTQLAIDMKFVYAYDELQSIFQTKAPNAAAIFGTNENGEPLKEFEKDVVLYKCYRNPREILVCAHAIGFGIYGKPVQMLENEAHWNDVGYEVALGPLQAGKRVEILRPAKNSLPLLSELQKIDELVDAAAFKTSSDEIASVVKTICDQKRDGLRADDIVVVVVDDLNARHYLDEIEIKLAPHGIACNNIHESYGVPDFQIEHRVTLSTVHKAKGNEGFAVHVVGADAAFRNPTKINRNRLFTAMTRAKAWLRVTGVGEPAVRLAAEINQAKKNSPNLCFEYPSRAELETMRRDLNEEDVITEDQRQLLESMSDELVDAYLRTRRQNRKGQQ